MADRSVNQIQLIGRLGQDPDMRYTPSGTPVTQIRLAVNRRPRTDEQGNQVQETDWFPCILWQKLAEVAAEHLHKGDRVYVSGRMQSRSYERDGQKHTVWEAIVNDLVMLGSPRHDEHGQQGDSDDPEELEGTDVPF